MGGAVRHVRDFKEKKKKKKKRKKWTNLTSFSIILCPWDDDFYRTSGGYK